MKQQKILALPHKPIEQNQYVGAESLINMFNSNFSELKTILEMAKIKSKDNKWRQ